MKLIPRKQRGLLTNRLHFYLFHSGWLLLLKQIDFTSFPKMRMPKFRFLPVISAFPIVAQRPPDRPLVGRAERWRSTQFRDQRSTLAYHFRGTVHDLTVQQVKRCRMVLLNRWWIQYLQGHHRGIREDRYLKRGSLTLISTLKRAKNRSCVHYSPRAARSSSLAGVSCTFVGTDDNRRTRDSESTWN